MNFLIHFTTISYPLYNSIAVHLSKIYPGSRFAGTITAHGDVKGFLENQNEVAYEFLIDFDEVENRFLKEDIDYNELSKFEETLESKSLWRFMAMDMNWGYAFSKGSIPDKLPIDMPNEPNEILRIVSGYVKLYNTVLSDFNADVVLMIPGMNSMWTPILEQVCKNKNITQLSPCATWIQNYFALSPSIVDMTFPRIERTYKDIVEGKLENDLSPGEKCYQKIRSYLDNKNKSNYFWYFPDKEVKKAKKNYKLPVVLSYIRSLCIVFIQWNKRRVWYKEKYKKKAPYELNKLFYYIRYKLKQDSSPRELLNKSFFDKYDPTQKYLYYPLARHPEYATQVQGNMWINQLTTIEALAKSVPFDWKVYVKEHPAKVSIGVRPPFFYEEIKSYPNVDFIPMDTDSNEVIKNSQLVVAISSTPGWEAILLHDKPVIHLVSQLYEVTGLSKRCNNLLQLSNDIHTEINRIKQITPEERKKRLVYLINAVIMNGFWIENPLISGLNTTHTKMTKTEIKDYGEKIANAVKQYLNGS